MGRKRTWKRKYICFYLSYIIIFMVSGCATQPKEIRTGTTERDETRWHILGPDDSREDQRTTLALEDKKHGDGSLFRMGLYYADPSNPKKDTNKSAALLKRLIREYPKSALADSAEVILDIMQESSKWKRQYSDSSHENQRLQKQALEMSQEIDKLKQVIEDSKKVDIEMGAKKREQRR
jgi:hypothetical protein